MRAATNQGWIFAGSTGKEMMKIRNLLTGLVFSVFAASSLASSGLAGQPAPDFVLKSSTGENLRLSEYRGDVVMINFWATWCGPCRQEMPLLDELYSRYQRVGFNLLGVNIDDDSSRAMTPSRLSSRRPALRWPSSGPWHLKQFSDRTGKMSRLKS